VVVHRVGKGYEDARDTAAAISATVVAPARHTNEVRLGIGRSHVLDKGGGCRLDARRGVRLPQRLDMLRARLMGQDRPPPAGNARQRPGNDVVQRLGARLPR